MVISKIFFYDVVYVLSRIFYGLNNHNFAIMIDHTWYNWILIEMRFIFRVLVVNILYYVALIQFGIAKGIVCSIRLLIMRCSKLTCLPMSDVLESSGMDPMVKKLTLLLIILRARWWR